MKKVIPLFIVLFFAAMLPANALSAPTLESARFASDVKLKVFGNKVESEIVSAKTKGIPGFRNYVSARDLAEYLGYQVSWDEKNKTISVDTYPVNGEMFDPKNNPEFDKTLTEFLGKFSTRGLDSFQKDLAILQKNVKDPVTIALMIVEDYKTYSEGGESSLGYLWTDLDK